jgi:hypothetical protein
MTDPAPRLDRAIRLTPRADRDRYEAEWLHDLAAADAHGLSPRDVERGAMRLAVNLRARHIERLLLGGYGLATALRSWLILVALLVAAAFLGGIVLLFTFFVLIALVVVLARAGTPSHWSHWLMVISIVTGAASAAFVWWATVAAVDAADNFTPEPAATTWSGAALILFALSALALVGSAVISATRERRAPR